MAHHTNKDLFWHDFKNDMFYGYIPIAIVAIGLSLLTYLYEDAHSRTTACWYMPTGNKTFYGESYSGDSLTCAANAYDYGDMLRVVNTDNGKAVIVRVTDKHAGGNFIDLSHEAFSKIANLEQGRIPVKITRMK